MILAIARVMGSRAGKALVAAVFLAAAAGAIYIKGRADGRASVLAGLADKRVTILKDGKAIDDATDLLDDEGLCAVLGGCGMPDGAGRD